MRRYAISLGPEFPSPAPCIVGTFSGSVFFSPDLKESELPDGITTLADSWLRKAYLVPFDVPVNCGKSSVIVNQGALLETKT